MKKIISAALLSACFVLPILAMDIDPDRGGKKSAVTITHRQWCSDGTFYDTTYVSCTGNRTEYCYPSYPVLDCDPF